jgi:hypothetical protein
MLSAVVVIAAVTPLVLLTFDLVLGDRRVTRAAPVNPAPVTADPVVDAAAITATATAPPMAPAPVSLMPGRALAPVPALRPIEGPRHRLMVQ